MQLGLSYNAQARLFTAVFLESPASALHSDVPVCVYGGRGGAIGLKVCFQPLSHTTDCKFDSAVYEGVGVVNYIFSFA